VSFKHRVILFVRLATHLLGFSLVLFWLSTNV
jgi:hypothetical protein